MSRRSPVNGTKVTIETGAACSKLAQDYVRWLGLSSCNCLLQVRVLRLRKLKDRNIRIRVSPECEEREENKWAYEYSIAFGESMASLPGAGLGWAAARKQIEEGEEIFREAYDKKYEELMQKLDSGLRHVSACETKYFHEPDWYERFGYIYYAFMADRYKR